MIKKNRKQRRLEQFSKPIRLGCDCGCRTANLKDIPCGESTDRIESVSIDQPHTNFYLGDKLISSNP